MTTTNQRASLLALLLGLTAALALAAVSYSGYRSAAPKLAPAASAQQAQHIARKQRKVAQAAASPSYTTPYDRKMIVDHQYYSIKGMDPTIDVAVVNATPGAKLEQTAGRCLNDALAHEHRATAAACYVFASREAFDAFNHTTTTRSYKTIPANSYPLSTECWVLYGKLEKAGATPSVSDMRLAPGTWDQRGCPKSWKGTS